MPPAAGSPQTLVDVSSDVLLQDAVSAWGSRQLAVLEAEDRLSVACEKGLTEDPVLLSLRQAFQVGQGLGIVASELQHLYIYIIQRLATSDIPGLPSMLQEC
jgi:hypothetical protein